MSIYALVSESGLIHHWNREAERLLGDPKRSADTLELTDLLVEDDRAAARHLLERARTSGSATAQLGLRTPGERAARFDFQATPIRVEDTTVLAVEGSAATPEPSRPAGEADPERTSPIFGSRRERRSRLLFENALDGIAFSRSDGTILDVNPELCRMSGYAREELRDRPLEDLFTGPVGEELSGRWKEANGPLHVEEAQITRRDGRRLAVEITATALSEPADSEPTVQTWIRDVTSHKAAEQAIRESEEKFRALAEHAPIGIGLVQHGVLKYLNPAYAEIFGYDRSELQDEPYTQFVHPDDRELVREKIDRRLSGDSERVQYEYRGVTRDGEERIIRVHGAAITYRGKPAAIGTLTDVTDRQRLQRELLEIQEEERRSIGRHLHDSIASQLSGAAMLAGALRRRLDGVASELRSDLEEVIQSIREADAKAWSLARGLYPTNLDQNGLASALRGLTRDEGDLTDVFVRYDGPEQIVVPGSNDANHLYWIAREAVTNARRHASPSEIVIEVSESDGRILLEVTDDGSGFDPSRHRESGLGLRTMQYRAELIGGSLTIRSRCGRGTSVRCRAPSA